MRSSVIVGFSACFFSAAVTACTFTAAVSPSLSFASPLLSNGVPPPVPAAAIFEPGLISSDDDEFYGITFSPDGTEAYWSRNAIYMSRLVNGRWSIPQPLAFSAAAYRDTKPVLSADGRAMIFASNRPIDGIKPAHAAFMNLWISKRTADGWSEPAPLPPPINTEWDEDFPLLAGDGAVYFVSNRKGNIGAYSQFRAEQKGAGFAEPVEAGLPFIGTNEALSWIAPDESYALFTSMRKGGAGAADVYIAFRNGAGQWSSGINAGPAINSAGVEWCARVSPDGRWVYFSSDREKRRDIYRVDTSVLRALNPTE